MRQLNLDLTTVLVAGVVAGSIDILAAALINHVEPSTVSRAIASGVFGSQAFRRGRWIIAAGIFFQAAMASIIAAIFYLAVDRLALPRTQVLLAGIAYGVPVYLVMTYVVVPCSRARSHFPGSLAAAIPDLIAMMVFGLIIAATPIAIIALRALSNITKA